MPAFVEATATANASKEAVWKILADFPNIANHTDTVKASVSTSEEDFAVGASRRCDLAPLVLQKKKSSRSSQVIVW